MFRTWCVVLLAGAIYARPFDVAPFARPCCSADEHTAQTMFDYRHPAGVVARPAGGWSYGLQWAEERDIREVKVRFRAGYDASKITLQYWFSRWPYSEPGGHTIEDPVDDPWHGSWIAPKMLVSAEGNSASFRFPALSDAENPRGKILEGVTYRRTLRLRLLFAAGTKPDVAAVEVFGDSEARPYEFRIRFTGAGARTATFEAWNGFVRQVKETPNGTVVRVEGAGGGLAGSNDITMVKVRRQGRAFTFAPAELDKGPMYVPDFQAYITQAADERPFSEAAVVRKGRRIRERLELEPEQSYERASREIPPLDPLERSGGPLMLALAADASWQKFGFEWGGHVYISKKGTKAKGGELDRLSWPGDAIRWRIGTGEEASFRDRTEDSTMTQLEGYLPVGIARWREGGFEFEEEAFATLLSGPLAPEGAGRDEQTPAVLMIRLRIRNTGGVAQPAHVWIAMRPGERLVWDGEWVKSATGAVRARLKLPTGATAITTRCRETAGEVPALHMQVPVVDETDVHFAIPYIPDLDGGQRSQLAGLDYAAERTRVVDYWRQVTANTVPFAVPEPRFNLFARGVVARIRLSATKDPKSGLYMIPAASYRYQVYANESAFQCQMLDVFGAHDLAGKYLQTHVALQGSKRLDGSFTGDQKDVYYGARVDADRDYTATPYNLNHGTVLWTLAEHYFFSRDKAWLQGVSASMKRAADWVIEQRKLTSVKLETGEPCPEYGLLPAGHLEDNPDWGHWFSVNAYASAGLSRLAEALRETGDADAQRYEAEARAYRTDLRAAVERAMEDAPVVRLRDNTYVPYVPTRALQRIRLMGPVRVAYYSRYGNKNMPTFRLAETRELLYGPMILFDTGIYGVEEPIARWVLDDWEDNATMSEPYGLNVHGWVDEDYWFSRGGMVFQANLQNPVRTYLRRGEIPAAIRNLYNDFVSCYYPSVGIFTEEYRRWRYPSGPFFKVADEAKFVHRLRDMLVTESDGDLHLARGTPERWLEPGQEIVVNGAATQYGPVSYKLRAEQGSVRGFVAPPTRNPYRDAWISVRVPWTAAIASVEINGKDWREFDAATGRIRLPKGESRIELVVRTVRR